MPRRPGCSEMNLILLEPDEIQADGTARLSGARARHVREVLKAAPGQAIRVGVIDGPKGTAAVIADGQEIRLQCELNGGIPSLPRVDLLLALPRPKVMNRLWPVLASLGVGRIFISNAWKTERCYFDSHVLEPAQIRAGLMEGLQQAQDTRLPQVSVHRRFKKLIEDELAGLESYAARLVAQPGPRFFPIDWLSGLPAAGRVLLAVGPEGGWIPSELELLAAHGFTPVSWGPRTLRTDTACSVLLGFLHIALG